MRKYQHYKNAGGGFLHEFFNAASGLYIAAKNRSDSGVKKYNDILDSWDLEYTKQNEIMALAVADRSAGVPTFKLLNILKGV